MGIRKIDEESVYMDLCRVVETALYRGVCAKRVKELLAEAWSECLREEARHGAREILK